MWIVIAIIIQVFPAYTGNAALWAISRNQEGRMPMMSVPITAIAMAMPLAGVVARSNLWVGSFMYINITMRI